ncbi:MAG: hypothetical protein OQK82_07880 [Candidatus Pacearchaeota archaeon]|nr:hypothetical protein [Candidatus Pacearchaeota archaeon]
MVRQTNKQAQEAAIEKFLTGTCLEDLKVMKEGDVPFDQSHGYPQNYKAQYAIDDKLFWQFLQNTQAYELEILQKNGVDNQVGVPALSEAEWRK